MIWPDKVHISSSVMLNKNIYREPTKRRKSSKRMKDIQMNYLIQYDDRDISAGEKFAEADLIGCPKRIIVSEKSLKAGGAEVTDLKTGESEIEKIDSINI